MSKHGPKVGKEGQEQGSKVQKASLEGVSNDASLDVSLEVSVMDHPGKIMSNQSQAPVGSHWKLKNDPKDRVWIVMGRGFQGSVLTKQEDRAVFGESKLSDFLNNHNRL